MSVPDTTTFSLQDVVDEISPDIESQQDSVDSALPWGWDATYEGDHSELSDFRNYTHFVWTEQTGISNRTWGDVTYNTGFSRFVAVSEDGFTSYSANNGVAWTEVSPPEANQWSSCFTRGGNVVSVAFNGTNETMYSTDGGSTWNAVAAAASSTVWECVGDNGSGSTFIAGGFNASASAIMRSSNGGVSWAMIPDIDVAFTNANWRTVAGRSGIVIALGGAGGVAAGMRSTDNGLTYTAIASFPALTGIWDAMWCTGTTWVVTGTDSFAFSTDSGVSWTEALSFPAGQWESVAYGANGAAEDYVVCVASVRPSDPTTNRKCAIAEFSDLTTWYLLDMPFGTWTGVHFNPSLDTFCAVSSSGGVAATLPI